jgi:hypothetical protein
VRLTSVKEDAKYNLDCEAEPFLYGANAPDVLQATALAPYIPNSTQPPASVNPPIIFEPVPRLANGQIQLWIGVSDSDPVYGGCQVQISTDGGNSYNPIGQIIGNCVTGFATADWPPNGDPDTTNDLPALQEFSRP